MQQLLKKCRNFGNFTLSHIMNEKINSYKFNGGGLFLKKSEEYVADLFGCVVGHVILFIAKLSYLCSRYETPYQGFY